MIPNAFTKAYVGMTTVRRNPANDCSMKLHYMKITTLGLSDTDTCSANDECPPGSYCDGTCKKCHGSCQLCTGGATTNCTRCSQFSTNWKVETNPTNALCTCKYIIILVEYWDINQFRDFSINDIPVIKTRRATIGLWIYFASPEIADGVFHIVVSDLLVMTFKVDLGINDVTTYCTSNQMYHSKLPINIGTSTYANFNTAIIQNYYTGHFVTATMTSIAGRWFYARCGVNYITELMYVSVDYNKGTPYEGLSKNFSSEDTIPKETIFFNNQNIRTDIRYRKFYKSTDKTILSINGLIGFSTSHQVFMKNLYLFAEYIPPLMNTLQY